MRFSLIMTVGSFSSALLTFLTLGASNFLLSFFLFFGFLTPAPVQLPHPLTLSSSSSGFFGPSLSIKACFSFLNSSSMSFGAANALLTSSLWLIFSSLYPSSSSTLWVMSTSSSSPLLSSPTIMLTPLSRSTTELSTFFLFFLFFFSLFPTFTAAPSSIQGLDAMSKPSFDDFALEETWTFVDFEVFCSSFSSSSSSSSSRSISIPSPTIVVLSPFFSFSSTSSSSSSSSSSSLPSSGLSLLSSTTSVRSSSFIQSLRQRSIISALLSSSTCNAELRYNSTSSMTPSRAFSTMLSSIFSAAALISWSLRGLLSVAGSASPLSTSSTCFRLWTARSSALMGFAFSFFFLTITTSSSPVSSLTCTSSISSISSSSSSLSNAASSASSSALSLRCLSASIS
mmetsp:Transcript_17696/g.36734  ORF Transcript_17696/g.36734 Transcript_17696/m.36734 type:complete len:398 (-) Transcript_17696:67-1260(-)